MTPTHSRRAATLALASALALAAGCSDATGTIDGFFDAGDDAGMDVSTDIGGADTGGADTTEDTGGEDATGDTTEDTTEDTGPICEDACEDGATRCEGTVLEACTVGDDGCLAWATDADCAATAQLCVTTDGASACVDSACDDGLVGGDESDIDCGGSCDGCADGLACVTGEDCASGVCEDLVCASATCGDGVVNGEELCDDGNDVDTDICTNACLFATCEDGATNGEETDVDCGGADRGDGPEPTMCGRCPVGAGCIIDEDCEDALICDEGVCGPRCDEEDVVCDDVCVDLDSDPDHCGACGSPCDEGFFCDEGTCAVAEITFEYAGTMETWTVPPGVTEVQIDAWGAQGGGAIRCNASVFESGGLGGYAEGLLTVEPGDVLSILVGGQGEPAGGIPTVGGGGAAGTYGGSGGGASTVYLNGTALEDRVLVAGGGGGGNAGCPDHGEGGDGGGLEGGDGISLQDWLPAGGATQLAGGTAGERGAAGTAGAGAGSTDYHFAGGGGGYYGGGSAYAAGGGGGSSFVEGLTDASTTAGENTGDGSVRIQF